MRILLVGDVVGKPGRQAVKKMLPALKKEYGVVFVIANGENAAGGNGITAETAQELLDAGVDVLTMGNHVWDKKEALELLDVEPKILRPANYPAGCPGRGWGVFPAGEGLQVGVVNLSGRVFMSALDCPFRKAMDITAELRRLTPIICVDFHGEATSEKVAFGYFLDGKASCVVGTHTHVQTADQRLLPKGTAYMTDLGMTGPYNSVLGLETSIIISRFIYQMPARFEVAKGPIQLNGAVVEIDDFTGKAIAIEPVRRVWENL